MNPRLLLDTHVLVRWLAEPRKLSREQLRVLREAVRRSEPVAISAISLLEMAVLSTLGKVKFGLPLDEFFGAIEAHPLLHVLPLTFQVALEVAGLGTLLMDPADRTIVATARIRRLRLVTSDQRITESGLVAFID